MVAAVAVVQSCDTFFNYTTPEKHFCVELYSLQNRKKKKNTIRQSLLLSTSLLQQIGRTRVIALITLCALADVSITKDGTASAAVGLSSVLLTLTIQMTRILGLQEAFVGT